MTQPAREYTEPVTGPIAEAPMERTEQGQLRRSGPGWFLVNAADVYWNRDDMSTGTSFQGAVPFAQYGFNLDVLQPGAPSTRYHREMWEDESFFVISGECIVLVEGEERPMRAGDFFHSPAGTAHAFVGAGDGPCTMVTVGARGVRPESDQPDVVYEYDEVAARYGACVAETTSDPGVAYAHVGEAIPSSPGWVPG